LRQSAKSTEGKKGSVTLNDVRFTPKADIRLGGISAKGNKRTCPNLSRLEQPK